MSVPMAPGPDPTAAQTVVSKVTKVRNQKAAVATVSRILADFQGSLCVGHVRPVGKRCLVSLLQYGLAACITLSLINRRLVVAIVAPSVCRRRVSEQVGALQVTTGLSVSRLLPGNAQ